jgi:hypothetical protein
MRRSTRGVPYEQWIRVGMPKIPESVLQSIFYLYANEEDAKAGENPGGTGFVVEIRSERELSSPHYYGVTNWHVACDGYPVIRLNTLDGKVDILDFNPDQWEFLPGKYDVAVIPLSLDPEIHAVHSIEQRLFVADPNHYYVGDDVFMIGLFIDHGGVSTNVPSARFGNISMLPNEQARIIQEATGYDGISYVVDMHSRTWFSGSPVFAYRTFGSDLTAALGHVFDDLEFDFSYGMIGQPSGPRRGRLRTRTHIGFLGIHWGQFPEEWELHRKQHPIKEARKRGLITKSEYVKGMSGMTCVIPAWQILEVLNLQKLKNQRDAADSNLSERRLARPLPESAAKKSNPNHLEDFTRLVDVAARKRPQGDQT